MTHRLAYLPVLLVTVGLFGGGLLLAALQSLGMFTGSPEDRWSLDGYLTVLRDRSFWSALGMTLWIAGAGTALAALLGTGLALALWWSGAGTALRFLFAWNLPLPHVVAAWVTVLLLSQSGLLSRVSNLAGITRDPAGFPALVNDPRALGVLIELTWKEAPFIGVAVLAALARLDPRLLDVARTLGASRHTRLMRVVLPAVLPAVRTTSLLVLAFVFATFEVPYLLGPTSPATLPVLAYRAFTDPDLAARPQAMAIGVLTATVGVVVALAWWRLTTREEREP